MKLFDQNYTTTIAVSQATPVGVALAAADLQKNLRRLSGKADAFPIVKATSEALANLSGGIIITCGPALGTYLEKENEAEKINKVASCADWTTAERYRVTISKDTVRITGTDTLGTIYGIYAFCEKALGIDPMYRMTDVFPARREELTLEEAVYESTPYKVRFRGWFLNDEDLLGDFKYGFGSRNITYPFYQNVMHPEVLDMVLETALRLGFNLVIPGSFINIDNPPEEALVQTAVNRGLYVSQHHVEPLGVSYFGAELYQQKYSVEGQFSYISDPKFMEYIWREYVRKWAKYKDNVIWQFGLRGKGDEYFWKSDSTAPDSMEERGNVLSGALATQHRIVCEELGTDKFYSTTTLWQEGGMLYSEGYLKFPKDTIIIFADLGLNLMLGDDFFTVKRKPQEQYGIYYHAAFWALGPHFTEGCDPNKMAYNYKLAAEADSLTYSIMNISNVRPLHMSAYLNAQILKDPLNYDPDACIATYDKKLFGAAGEKVSRLRRKYFDALAVIDESWLDTFTATWAFLPHVYERLSFAQCVADDGKVATLGKNVISGKKVPKVDLPEALYDSLCASRERLEVLCEALDKAEQEIPEEMLAYYRTFLKHQARHMYLLTKWCIACFDCMEEGRSVKERTIHAQAAVTYMEQVLLERQVEAQGQWKDWFRGDKKLDLAQSLQLTKDALVRLCH